MRQNVLDAHPRAPLRVYAVWFDAFFGDERARVDVGLLGDPRVTHLWDDSKSAGHWYARSLTRRSDPDYVEWDAFFLYPPGATWAEDGARPAAWGRTIMAKREDLRAAVTAALGGDTVDVR